MNVRPAMIADAATSSSTCGSRRPTVPLTPVVNAGALAARPRLSSFATPAEASTNARVVRIAVATLLITWFASSHRQPFVGSARQQSLIRSNGRARRPSRSFRPMYGREEVSVIPEAMFALPNSKSVPLRIYRLTHAQLQGDRHFFFWSQRSIYGPTAGEIGVPDQLSRQLCVVWTCRAHRTRRRRAAI